MPIRRRPTEGVLGREDPSSARRPASRSAGRSGNRPGSCPGASGRRSCRAGSGRPGGGRRQPRRPAPAGAAPTTGPCPGSSVTSRPAPAGRWRPAPRPSSPSRPRDDSRRRLSRSGASSATSSARRAIVNDEVTPTWWSVPSASNRPSRSDPIRVPGPSLCQRKPATTQSAVRWCLSLSMARLPGWYGRIEALGDHPVEAGPLEPLEPVDRRRPIAGRRGEVDRRPDVGQDALEPACAARPGAPSAGRRRPRARMSQATKLAGDSAASIRTRDSAGWIRRSSASKSSRPSPPAMTTSPSRTQRSGSEARSRRGQLREIAVERLQVAGLDQDLVAVAEDERPKAVPFRLEQPAVVGRERSAPAWPASARSAG